MRRIVWTMSLGIVSVGADCPATAQTYAITDLGKLGGSYSLATGINATGQITGASNFHAFIYSGGQMTDLGTLGGDYSQGQGVNSSGQAAGYSTLSKGGYRAFLYSNGKMTNLGTLGGSYSVAYALNTNGDVVGSSLTSANLPHAFLWTGRRMTDLGTLGGNQPYWTTSAYGINDSLQIVGYSYLPSGTFHAFIWANGVMKDLGTLGGSYSRAFAINGTSQITGEASLAGDAQSHAFLYTSGKMTDLGALNNYSSGLGINSSGTVVGTADVKNSSGYLVYHAVIYLNGSLQDLNNLIPLNSRWVLSAATSINDSGEIVGEGTINGEQHGFVLVPKSTT
jgi:probable HAF family extracellular repeat protein